MNNLSQILKQKIRVIHLLTFLYEIDHEEAERLGSVWVLEHPGLLPWLDLYNYLSNGSVRLIQDNLIAVNHVNIPGSVVTEALFEALFNYDEIEDERISRRTKPIACIGCLNYHGKEYRGIQLICGIYPQGWEGESCPDWRKP